MSEPRTRLMGMAPSPKEDRSIRATPSAVTPPRAPTLLYWLKVDCTRACAHMESSTAGINNNMVESIPKP